MKILPLFFVALFAHTILVAQWTRTNGLRGGGVADLIWVGDTIIANAGELYFSIDCGDHWSVLPNTPKNFFGDLRYSDGALLLHSHEPENALWWSQDVGQTWTEVKLIDTFFVYEFLKIGPQIFVSSFQGLFRTSDNGYNWEKVLSSPINSLVADKGVINVAIYDVNLQHSQVLQSPNGGATWGLLLSVPENIVDISQRENYLLVFLMDVKYCWHSTDSGLTWEKRNLLNNFESTSDIIWDEDNILWANYGSLIFSQNNGDTWGYDPVHRWENIICTITQRNDTTLIGTLFKGVFRRVHPDSSWQWKNEGLFAAIPSQLTSTGTGLYGPYDCGLSKLESNGQDWSLETIGLPTSWGANVGAVSYLEINGRRLIIYGWSIFYQEPQSDNWQKSVIEMPDSLSYHFNELYFLNDKIIAHSYNFNRLFVSNDAGKTFYPLDYSYQGEEIIPSSHFLDGGVLYMLDYDQNLFRSMNSGQDWVLELTLPTDYCTPISNNKRIMIRDRSIFVFPSNPHPRRLIFSPNMGEDWYCYDLTAGERPWAGARINDLKKYGSWLFLSTSFGVYVSNDKGVNWLEWNLGLKGQFVEEIVLHNQYLWASCIGFGVWKRPISELNALLNSSEASSNINRLLPRPNPAIDYSMLDLPEDGILQIWDYSGKLMMDAKCPAGEIKLSFNDWKPGLFRIVFTGGQNQYEGALVLLPRP
jgi:photosystem II stability/assembly factor-like uncharacterized protein